MKDNINNLLDPNISPEEEDKILEQFLAKKLDNDLKVRWQEMLREEHDIATHEPEPQKKSKSSTYIKMFLAAAACITLIVTLQVLYNAPVAPNTLAQNYLEEQEILHPGVSKGTITEDKTRVTAIQEFNAKKYVTAATYFQKLESPNEEDLYYHGLSLLLSKDYRGAIAQFNNSIKTNPKYEQEIRWYQSLAYVLSKKTKKAKQQLQQIKPTDWNYKKAQELLKEMNEE
ncbi:tetratricopeptide repeat protein [Aquimarina algicola]|uniref:Tetratricopeptide repeat protein n=1 Tax=Aquimarina algicola TaxID=2589995 RepID=A0A504IWZ8_9FLAO|nr:hypothetical protein [Aquimarina algicola]TPN83007.1 hypothetical protein FHK87_21525 [Aquimarina algicola]